VPASSAVAAEQAANHFGDFVDSRFGAGNAVDDSFRDLGDAGVAQRSTGDVVDS
jgi:hypothetical protein